MTQQTKDDTYQRAKRRVKDLQDFYGHLVIYLVVNAIFILIDLADGPGETEFLGLDWAYYPIIGWGIFLAVHAVATIGFEGRRFFGADWEQRKLEQFLDEERHRELG